MDASTGEWVDEEVLCYAPAAMSPGDGGANTDFCHGLTFLDSPYGCGRGEECVEYGTNPKAGAVNFDNVLFGILTLFSACTMEVLYLLGEAPQ